MKILLLITFKCFASTQYPTEHWNKNFLSNEEKNKVNVYLADDYFNKKQREELRTQSALFFSFLHQNLVKESQMEIKNFSIHELLPWPDNVDLLENYMQQIERQK